MPGCLKKQANQTLKYAIKSLVVVSLLNSFFTGSAILGLYLLAKVS